MLNKILWSICGTLLFTFLAIFLFRNEIYFSLHSKQVKSAEIRRTDSKQLEQLENNSVSTKSPIKISENSPNILSDEAYLMDMETGKKLYGKNEKERVPIASLTKIVTAIVILENYPNNLKDEVEIERRMTGITGDNIGLKYGETISVENLLYGLLMMSGNDAAAALSTHFGGRDMFVGEMNQKLKTIKARDTFFMDPAGLDDDGYSTAYDLALITSYALKNPKFAEIVKTEQKNIPSANGRINHELKNSNRLLLNDEKLYYPLATGVKTGFTTPAGHVMVTSAQKDGHTIIGVVLHTNKNSLTASAEESKKLLEWGFESWKWE